MGWVGGTTSIYVCLWAGLLVAIVFQCCGCVVECCVEEERLALLQIKSHMKLYACDNDYNNNGMANTRFSNSEIDDECCEWPEVRCDMATGRVTELDLSEKVRRFDADARVNPWMFNVSLFSHFKELVSLDLSYNKINGLVDKDGSTNISTLSNLRILKLDYNSFETGYLSVTTLTLLTTLTLCGNHLNDSSFPLSQELADLTKLQILDLSLNSFSSHPIQDFCKLRNLELLKLGSNSISGIMPTCLQNLSSLQLLDLSSNHLTGTLPSTLSNLTSLHFLDISYNNFVGKWSLSSLFNHSKLQVLRLSGNKLEVQTEDYPWQPMFQLRSLSLARCNLNKHDGSIPKFLFYQRNLRDIDLSHNNLIGPFPTWLLSNNSKLRALNLANNAIIAEHLLLPPYALSSLVSLDISRNNFQGNLPENIGVIFSELKLFNISGNHFEGHIPTSVGDMRVLRYLDFSNNNFSGEVPRKIYSHCNALVTLQLSDNNLQGDIIPEDISLPMLTWLKLSNNHFDGTIKEALQISTFLNYFDVSSNTVTGKLPPWIGYFSMLSSLSISKNNFHGRIPRELCKLQNLDYLDLSENNFIGPIPSCSNFSSLTYIHLHNNRFTGTIPSALSSFSNLETLDLRANRLSGGIPYRIHKLSNLRILLLAKNRLHGRIPYHLCKLKYVNILDLSSNNLLGEIPPCFGNMSFGWNTKFKVEGPSTSSSYDDNRSFMNYKYNGKREEVEFLEKNQYLPYSGGVLVLMSGLDLSCNKLSGIIPPQLGELTRIHSLNFSHNRLLGAIPSSFSQLKQLESLDLSYNTLSGAIPPQLVELTFLVGFNVSYNNLTGRVPKGGQFADFDERNYFGNPGLYGYSKCYINTTLPPDDPSNGGGGDQDDEEETYMVDFWWSFAMSCIIIFLATVAILCINPQWRNALFYFVDSYLIRCQWLLKS